MPLNLGKAITELSEEKKISPELIVKTIENSITMAYKKYFGTVENLVIKQDDNYVFHILSIKEVVEKMEDDLYEISLEDAKKIKKGVKIGDKIEVPCDIGEFGFGVINTAKQILIQKLKEIEKNSLYSEFKSQEKQLIIGFVQRIDEKKNIYVNLGNCEGFFPRTEQCLHENYKVGERVKAIILSVFKSERGMVSILLSRRSPEFVRRLLEIEIPEIYDKTIQIKNIVREAGYKTKLSVFTEKPDIDPVGSCVGPKGARIQNIIKELEGEKIDVIRWSNNIKEYVANSLTPAVVDDVIIQEDQNKAIAIMNESQLSLAIGIGGANIKLAKQLTGMEIEVFTEAEAIEKGILTDHIKLANQLFSDEEEQHEIESLDLSQDIIEALINNKIYTVEQLVEIEDVSKLKGFTKKMAQELKKYIEENIVIDEDIEEVYQCPNCGGEIRETDTKCPKCGIEISFEE